MVSPMVRESLVLWVNTYHCLYQLHPLLSDPIDDSRNVHYILFLNLLQNMVYGDECTSTTYSSTERERERPDSVAERLCSKAVDWEVSGSILAMGILSLTGPSPTVLK